MLIPSTRSEYTKPFTLVYKSMMIIDVSLFYARSGQYLKEIMNIFCLVLHLNVIWLSAVAYLIAVIGVIIIILLLLIV